MHADTTVRLSGRRTPRSACTTTGWRTGPPRTATRSSTRSSCNSTIPRSTGPAVDQAEQASLDARARLTSPRAGQSATGAGPNIAPAPGAWPAGPTPQPMGMRYLARRLRSAGNGRTTRPAPCPLAGQLNGAAPEGWCGRVVPGVPERQGIDKVVVRGDRRRRSWTSSPWPPRSRRPAPPPRRTSSPTRPRTGQRLAGTAKVDRSYSQAHGGWVRGHGHQRRGQPTRSP